MEKIDKETKSKYQKINRANSEKVFLAGCDILISKEQLNRAVGISNVQQEMELNDIRRELKEIKQALRRAGVVVI